MSNSPKSFLWALKPGAENIAEQARHAQAGQSLRHSWGCLAIKIKRMTCQTGPVPPYLPPFWPKLNVNSLLMFKWTNHVKPCNSSPSPSPFSLKTPSFQALWSKPLSPVWDTFRPRAPPLNYLMFLHQGILFCSWFLGAHRIGNWVGFPH